MLETDRRRAVRIFTDRWQYPAHLAASLVVMRPTDESIAEMWALAAARQAPKDRQRALVSDKRTHLDRDNVAMHYLGLKGEMAVARYYGVPFDRAAYLAGDARGDLVLGRSRVEVKNRQRYLIITSPDEWEAPLAVLVNPFGCEADPCLRDGSRQDRRAIALVGWICREDFLRDARRRDFGYGPRLCVELDAMQPMQALGPRESTFRSPAVATRTGASGSSSLSE